MKIEIAKFRSGLGCTSHSHGRHLQGYIDGPAV